MKDPEMAGRRERTREGRERKRAREQRPKLLLILGSGLVLITLVGLTVWNVLSTKADSAARSERAKAASSAQKDGQPDLALEATLGGKAKAVVGGDPAEILEIAVPAANPPAVNPPAVKTTVSEKQRSLESARDRYLARSLSGAEVADTAGTAKSAAAVTAGDEAAEVDPDSIDEAEKERVLRKIMPFYRSQKKRDAPPVSAEELYLPKPK